MRLEEFLQEAVENPDTLYGVYFASDSYPDYYLTFNPEEGFFFPWSLVDVRRGSTLDKGNWQKLYRDCHFKKGRR